LNALEELEMWKSEHKSHAVEISIDDGYGATCWTVKLSGRDKKVVTASEASFFPIPPDKVPPEVVFVVPPNVDETDEDWDWPGLGPTILAAVKRARELGL
jgi:hypothetical protein